MPKKDFDHERFERDHQDMKDEVGYLNSKVSTFENTLVRIEVLLERLTNDFKQVLNVESRVIKLETKLEELEKNLATENTRNEKLADKLDSMGIKIATIIGGITVAAQALSYFI